MKSAPPPAAPAAANTASLPTIVSASSSSSSSFRRFRLYSSRSQTASCSPNISEAAVTSSGLTESATPGTSRPSRLVG